jgi:hypothetical protein
MKQRVKTVLAFLLVGWCLAGAASDAVKYRLPGFGFFLSEARSMNGIDPKAVGNFWDKWHPVNARWRQDVNEIRFVYANPIAWKAITEGKAEFPTGSMFGKLAFHVHEDAAFTNSLEPDIVQRVQLMKKDPVAYKATNGWGYALYLPSSKAGGQMPPNQGFEDIKDQMVCHACHTLVKDRDYVFTHSALAAPMIMAKNLTGGLAARFSEKKVSDLSEYERTIFKEVGSYQTIQFASMPLFVGSEVEAMGPLAKLALEKKVPYFLVDDRYQQFLLVMPDSPNSDCDRPARIIRSVEEVQSKIWLYAQFCDGSISAVDQGPVPPAVAKLEEKPTAPSPSVAGESGASSPSPAPAH